MEEISDESPVVQFVEMVAELQQFRHQMIENIAALLENARYEEAKQFYKDARLSKFLLEDERDYLKKLLNTKIDPKILN
jgi:hypothetical protein